MPDEERLEVSDHITERTPLVTDRPGRPPLRPGLSTPGTKSKSKSFIAPATSTNVIVLLLCLATLIAASATGFTLMPLTRIVEDILCRQTYHYDPADPIDEQLCKGDKVQSKLAVIIAVTGALESLFGCLGALPWGIMADRIGRKPVIVLAIAGITLNLVCAMSILYFWTVIPLQLIWLAGSFQLLGGGQAIVAGGVLSLLSDLADEDQRANIFLRMHVASLAGQLASPALASTMMKATGPWPCLGVAVGLLILGGTVFVFVPESREQAKNAKNSDKSGMNPTQQLKQALGMLRSPSLLLLFLVALTASPVALSTLAFLVQYASARFGIPIFATGYIQTGYGAANMVFALGVIPAISRLALRNDSIVRKVLLLPRVKSERARDLVMAKLSFVLLVLGAVVLGLAPNLPLFCVGLVPLAAGAGYSSFTRSLVSFHVPPERRSQVFALVGMVEVLGNIYSQPMLAGLFSLGLRMGGEWVGLPYLGLSVLLAVAVGLLFFVRVEERVEGDGEEEEQEEELLRSENEEEEEEEEEGEEL